MLEVVVDYRLPPLCAAVLELMVAGGGGRLSMARSPRPPWGQGTSHGRGAAGQGAVFIVTGDPEIAGKCCYRHELCIWTNWTQRVHGNWTVYENLSGRTRSGWGDADIFLGVGAAGDGKVDVPALQCRLRCQEMTLECEFDAQSIRRINRESNRGGRIQTHFAESKQSRPDRLKPPSCNPAPSYAPHAHVARWKLPNNGAGGAREKMETGAKGAGGMGKKWRRRFAAAPGLFGTRVMNDPCHQKDMPRHSEAEPTKPNSSKLCPAHKFSQAVSNRISARFRAPDYACAHLHKIMTCTGVRPHSISDKCPTSGRPFRTIHPERVPPMCKGAGPLSSDRRQRWCGAARARRSPAPARRKAPNCAWCIPFVAPATTFNPGED
eukprot:gene7248-biopygen16534